MKLRQGRKVPGHIYLQGGDTPNDHDVPLFTTNARLAQHICECVNGMAALAIPVRVDLEDIGNEIWMRAQQ